jgi:hypothetical protein
MITFAETMIADVVPAVEKLGGALHGLGDAAEAVAHPLAALSASAVWLLGGLSSRAYPSLAEVTRYSNRIPTSLALPRGAARLISLAT